MDDISPFEPTVLGAMWKYRWLVLLIVTAVTALALVYSILSPRSHQAVATLVVEDPRASALFNLGAAQNPQRYVADQAAILESAVVAEGAAEAEGSLRNAEDVFVGLGVFWDHNANQIEVVFTAERPEVAIAGANAVVAAYGDVRQEASSADLEAALAQLDESITEVEAQLLELQARVEAELEGDPARQALNEQLDEALSRLVRVQAELPTAGGAELAELRAQMDDITQQIQTLVTVRDLDRQSPGLSALLDEHSETIARKADLLQRKDELSVDARMESDGIVLSSPAIASVEVGADPARLGAVGLVLGLLIAAGVAYLLALRRRTFEDRAQPELVLRAPLLAEVPVFRQERIRTELPVRTAPSSISAEAFRFVSAALEFETEDSVEVTQGTHVADPRERLGHTFIIVSPTVGDGKTVIAANTALASARQGKRVLAIDADFGHQRMSSLLTGDQDTQRGLTNLVERRNELYEVLQRVPMDDEGARLDLLSQGTIPVAAPDFFRSAGVKAFFEAVRDEYDLVIIDSPPMLHVAYASLLVRNADGVVVVVPDGSQVSQTEELSDRLDYLDARVVGYVYNKAQLRDDAAGSHGSLEDVQGRGIQATRRR